MRRVATITDKAGNASVSETSTVTYSPQGDVATIDGPLSGSADTSYFYYDDMGRPRASVSPDPDGAGALQRRVFRVTYSGERTSLSEVGYVAAPTSWASMTVLMKSETSYDSVGLPSLQTGWANTQVFSGTSASGGFYRYAIMQTGFDNDLRINCSAFRMSPVEFDSVQPGSCALDTLGSFGPDRINRESYEASTGDGTVSSSALGTSSLRDSVTRTFSPTTGLLMAIKDAGGAKTGFDYDEFNRLVKISFPNPTTADAVSGTDNRQVLYDAFGRMTQVGIRGGALTTKFAFTYDNLGRVTLEDAPGSDPDISYTYDNFGRVLTAAQPNQTITYVYDALSRLTSETVAASGETSRTVSYQYDTAGRRTRMTWPDGFYVTYDYNVVGDVTAIRENGAASGAGVLATFTYDNLGRRTALTRGNGSVTAYTFDGASNLSILAQDLSGSANDVSTGLNYNPAGQVAGRTVSNNAYNFPTASPFSEAYNSNKLNQYTSARGVAPTYDTRGNMTDDGTKTYAYDNRSRMITAGSASLTYDPENRLYQVAGASTTRLVYDGADLIAEYSASGVVLRRYVHGPLFDEPIVWYEGSTTADRRHLLADERGSIVAVEGATNTKNTYDAYGVRNSGNSGRFQYTGQTWVAEVGLYYYKARFYSAELGRFMQTDPVGYDAGMNMYAYIGNDPVNGTDSSGLCPESDYVCITSATIGNHGSFFVPDVTLEFNIPEMGLGEIAAVDVDTVQVVGIVRSPRNRRSGKTDTPMSWTTDYVVNQQDSVIVVALPLTPTATDLIAIPFLKMALIDPDSCAAIFSWECGLEAVGLIPGLKLGKFGKLAKACGCFVEGTLVDTPEGLKPIEDIEVGDLVMAWDEATGEILPRAVTDLIRPEPKLIWRLEALDAGGETEVFEVTADHPWYVETIGWVETKDLRAGQRIATADARGIAIVEIAPMDRVEHTYNLTVDGPHTFLVGDDGIVVHNACAQLINAAKSLGFKLDKGLGRLHGQDVFKRGNKFITRDVDSHIGGQWKVFEKRGGNLTRTGTYNGDLTVRLGD